MKLIDYPLLTDENIDPAVVTDDSDFGSLALS